MPDLSRFLMYNGRGADHVDALDRADSVAFMIGHNGTSIVLVRSSGALAAQTVLLVPVSQSRIEVEGEAGEASRDQVAIIGTRGHATIVDLDIARGDRFAYLGRQYEVTHVDKTMTGKTEAIAVAVS